MNRRDLAAVEFARHLSRRMQNPSPNKKIPAKKFEVADRLLLRLDVEIGQRQAVRDAGVRAFNVCTDGSARPVTRAELAGRPPPAASPSLEWCAA